MDLVVSNQKLSDDFYLMTVSKHFDPEREPLPRMGQFFMVRAWEDYPLLSRPLSIYDSVTRGHQTEASFLYSIVGKGTEIFGALKSGDSISIGRALGNAFPLLNGKVALVGGGAGIAPLHLAALSLKKNGAVVDTYLGFRNESVLTSEYSKISDKLIIDVGGFVTDRIDPSGYDCVMTCGPDRMMRELYRKCKASKTKLYVSLESRMACGFGVCLACTCDTKGEDGAPVRKRVCADGPVFSAEEVYEA